MNRMVCRKGWSGVGWVGMGEGVMGQGDVKLGLGDCVWCVLLPKSVANATNSSKSMPPVSHN